MYRELVSCADFKAILMPSHVIGVRGCQDLRSPSPIMAPGETQTTQVLGTTSTKSPVLGNRLRHPVNYTACTLVPTVFLRHGKTELELPVSFSVCPWHRKTEFEIHFSFSVFSFVETEIPTLIFVFRFPTTSDNRILSWISLSVFCLSFLQDIGNWNLNFDFRFSFSCHDLLYYLQMRVPKCQPFSCEIGKRNSNFRLPRSSENGTRDSVFVFRFPTSLKVEFEPSVFVFRFPTTLTEF